MRISKEVIDDNVFIDFIMDPRDVDALKEKALEPTIIRMGELHLNFWIRMATDREMYNDFECTDDE